MTLTSKIICAIFWASVVGLCVYCGHQSGEIKNLRYQLQADKELIQSLYEQIATTEIACDIEIEKAQVSCVD